jgi:hypothetical protein
VAAHPYGSLPDENFWRRVAPAWAEDPTGLYQPRLSIDAQTPIATVGSCFAQNIGRQLRRRGYNHLDLEPAPPGLDPDLAAAFGYGLFSCRSGNVYTPRHLFQLLKRAFNPAEDAAIWEEKGRFFDPFRPTLEPDGFGSLEELLALRRAHYTAIQRMLHKAQVLIFTLGLTELWEDAETGAAFPVCPGTAAGTFDPARHRFRNLSYAELLADLERVLALMQRRNPQARLLLTVSPVPLAATATRRHVVAATTHSKSLLRAVAERMRDKYDSVDYMPAYEIITSPLSQGRYFMPDGRNVSEAGVARVMECFFSAHGAGSVAAAPQPVAAEATLPATVAATASSRVPAFDPALNHAVGLVCDEERLDPQAAR